MKADTMITKEMLEEKGACSEGKDRFNLVFPNGGKYQDVFNACETLGWETDQDWLIGRFGEIESEYEFNVGDRVRVIKPIGRVSFGMLGIVKTFMSGDYVGVEWDILTAGHDGHGAYHGTDGHCWHVPTSCIEPAVKEVNRPAKVGEWVKIVDPKNVPCTGGKPDYKLGDILKTIGSCMNLPRYADGSGGHTARVLLHSEYVVLEGYEPPVEPAKEQNKYEKMTDAELYRSVCHRGACSADRSTERKKDCPLRFSEHGCNNWSTVRPEIYQTLIQYCLDEDAAKEQPKEKTAESTLPDTITINGCVYKRVDE